MRKVLSLLAALLLGGVAAPAMAEGFTAQQRAEIVEVVRAALKADPTILRDAITALQEQDARAQQAAARSAIAGLGDALTRAPRHSRHDEQAEFIDFALRANAIMVVRAYLGAGGRHRSAVRDEPARDTAHRR